MLEMFLVRSARALPAASTVGPSLHALLAPPPPPHPATSRPARRPSSYASLPTRQGAAAFNQTLSFDTSSVTTMQNMFSVRFARAPARSLHSWVLPARCLRWSRRPTPSRLPARIVVPLPKLLFHSAVDVGVQPAAELRHDQRHKHAGDA
eukprot:scaffold22637_cov41-Phaeocystis_antarctica.AAC.2